jgi:hypothetical protein
MLIGLLRVARAMHDLAVRHCVETSSRYRNDVVNGRIVNVQVMNVQAHITTAAWIRAHHPISINQCLDRHVLANDDRFSSPLASIATRI